MDPLTRARSARLPALVLLLALIVPCSACGESPPATPAATGPTCTPMPEEPPTLEGRAASFDLTGLAEPTGFVSQDGYLVINARAQGAITDLVIPFQEMVRAAGFDVAGSDDEGFEAEVFFARGDIAAGQVVLTKSACAGAVDVKISVLDRPEVFPDE